MSYTIHDLEQFERGSIWKAMQQHLYESLAIIHNQLENLPDQNGRVEFNATMLNRLGGCAQAVRESLLLVERLKEAKRLEHEKLAKERDDVKGN